jgi:hypothetical protein
MMPIVADPYMIGDNTTCCCVCNGRLGYGESMVYIRRATSERSWPSHMKCAADYAQWYAEDNGCTVAEAVNFMCIGEEL